jgi:hypothetical protein
MRAPRGSIVASVLLAAAVVLGGSASAQNFGPVPAPAPANPPATICNTPWGWCPVNAVLMPGAPCQCVVPPATALPGVARYWPYQGAVDPYLNPHSSVPSTIP